MTLEDQKLVSTREPHDITLSIPMGRELPIISYSPEGEQMISGFDRTVQRWDLQAEKEIEEAQYIFEQKVHAMGVSRNGRWVVTADDYINGHSELKVCEVETGIVRTFDDDLGTCSGGYLCRQQMAGSGIELRRRADMKLGHWQTCIQNYWPGQGSILGRLKETRSHITGSKFTRGMGYQNPEFGC